MIALFGCRSPIVVEPVETLRRMGLPGVGISVEGTPRTPYDFAVTELQAYRKGSDRHPFIPCAFSPSRRRHLADLALDLGCEPAEALVDPTSILPSTIRLGSGSFINAGCVIGGETLIGEFALINRAANLGHHVVIGSFVSIGPGATLASNIRIGEGSVIGAGATVLPDIRIGEGVVIGAGTVLRRDVPNNTFVAGNPAVERTFDFAASMLHGASDE